MKRSEIEERATQILRDHHLLTIPVDPLAIAKALNVPVMSAVFSEPDKSGAIVKRGPEFSIFVNANEAPARKRFTIAHEIGHKLLHMDSSGDVEFIDTEDNFRTTGLPDDNWTLERRREWEANAFAAALLMNEKLVRDEWQSSKDPANLAWKFQVSPPAMLYRLTQLGLTEAFFS